MSCWWVRRPQAFIIFVDTLKISQTYKAFFHCVAASGVQKYTKITKLDPPYQWSTGSRMSEVHRCSSRFSLLFAFGCYVGGPVEWPMHVTTFLCLRGGRHRGGFYTGPRCRRRAAVIRRRCCCWCTFSAVAPYFRKKRPSTWAISDKTGDVNVNGRQIEKISFLKSAGTGN